MRNVSALLVVHNEVVRITKTLDHISAWASDIVIVDQQSTDGTRDVIRRYLAENYFRLPPTMRFLQDRYHGHGTASRSLATRYAQAEWCCIIDADEELTPQFLRKMPVLLDTPNHVLSVLHETRIGTREPIFGFHTRFFRRGYATVYDELHRDPEPLNHMAAVTIQNPLAFLSIKSEEEQRIDDARFAMLEARAR